MSVFNTCPFEHLSVLLQKELGYVPTDEEINSVFAEAYIKRERIIAREGDANGERLKLYYLASLIAEKIIEKKAQKKHSGTKARSTKSVSIIIAGNSALVKVVCV
ncbi:MAG: hypothetical protein IJE19_03415 [Clostridia bacterium]|nr:hypothetical protein [Clostridia bacterium]